MINVYLRASTDEQDASRAKTDVLKFVNEMNVNRLPVQLHVENGSGASLDRPVLSELLNTAPTGSILVVEKLDRLTRLEWSQWERLKGQLKDKQIKIVCVDQTMTHSAFNAEDDMQSAINKALSNFILDLAAAMARDDYETRAKRQRQGIEKAKLEGKYKGRAKDDELRGKIQRLLDTKMSIKGIADTLGCSRNTVYKVRDGQ
ncbi:recombinase family protein [Vibrio sp. Isolate30]|uniref:recombinase family protein n=1 Tax=Vibrio sp. Isolate30 TaxID=2908536 RepID=UPI001EFE4FB6|nr:recombinase family protein [Vibrio sp. Isolate30]